MTFSRTSDTSFHSIIQASLQDLRSRFATLQNPFLTSEDIGIYLFDLFSESTANLFGNTCFSFLKAQQISYPMTSLSFDVGSIYSAHGPQDLNNNSATNDHDTVSTKWYQFLRDYREDAVYIYR